MFTHAMLNVLLVSNTIKVSETKSPAIWHFLQRRVAVTAYFRKNFSEIEE